MTVVTDDSRRGSADRREPGVLCPCCGESFASFAPHGRVPRPGARCPSCGALERHRLLYLYLGARTPFFTADLKVLHFAPEGCFHRWFRRLPNLDYTSADLMSPHAMEKVDITRIQWPDDTFDVVLCSHVLEHVPDDRRAMAEVRRVLKPGGWAILHVPMDRSREHTYEDDRIVSPQDRERHFGQHDHVRLYGRDFVERLEAAGFEVTVEAFGSTLEETEARRFGVRPGERIHLCVKPGVAGAHTPGQVRADGPREAGAGTPREPGAGARGAPLPPPLPRLVAEADERRRAPWAPNRVLETTCRLVPPGAAVLVVSRGDGALLDLGDRRGWHFPQGEGGVYAGHHPGDSAEAIAHLEELRARGGEYLVFPEPSFWWLDFYGGFRSHLDRNYRQVWQDSTCVVYRLAEA